MANPMITKIETVIFEHDIQDMGTDYNGFNLVYEKRQCPQDAVIDSADSYRYRGYR